MNIEQKPRVLVALGIIFNQKPDAIHSEHPLAILVSRRPEGKPYAGYWEFPGGKCDQDETLPECVKRELREELAIEVSVHETLMPHTYDYEHAHVHLHGFFCTIESGAPQAREVASFKWVPIHDLPGLKFPEGNEPLIQEILTRFAQKG